jgi:hypothetical protein
MNPRTTRVLLGAALLLTLAAAWFAPSGETSGEVVQAAARRTAASQPAAASTAAGSAVAAFADVLPIRPRVLDDGDDAPDAILFSSTQWSPSAAPAAALAPAPAAPAAAQVPPLPFRVLGSYERAGKTVVFLQQNDQNHVVGVGDTIADTYKVESLDGATMKLRYLPLDQVQTLELGRTLNEK